MNIITEMPKKKQKNKQLQHTDTSTNSKYVCQVFPAYFHGLMVECEQQIVTACKSSLSLVQTTEEIN